MIPKSTFFFSIVFCILSSFVSSWSPGSDFPCPEDVNVFDPCHCSVVSTDGVDYFSQITCSGVNGKQIQEALGKAYNHQNTSKYFDILEIRDVPLLNVCCENVVEGFRFKTIKIIDSKICVMHLNSFSSSYDYTNEIVMMDVTFTPNLVDGVQLFRVLRNFPHLKGFYLLTSNLEKIPQDAFRSSIGFGYNLETIRIINSQLSSISDFTFAKLPKLKWIDLSDNQIDRISSNSFYLPSETNEPLKISLSGNKLSSDKIQPGSFDNITRPVTIYLNNNNLQSLREKVFGKLLRRSNYVIYVDDNPFICDCRHRWLFDRKTENINQLREMKCVDDKKTIWERNLPNVCDRARIISDLPNAEANRQYIRRISYGEERSEKEGATITTEYRSGRIREYEGSEGRLKIIPGPKLEYRVEASIEDHPITRVRTMQRLRRIKVEESPKENEPIVLEPIVLQQQHQQQEYQQVQVPRRFKIIY